MTAVAISTNFATRPLTVWGTLRATKRQVKAANEAADREIKAASDAANRQITAAQEQTAAAQHQTAEMRDMEHRRIAREGCAFNDMLEAAMAGVIEDVETARKLPPPPPSEVARGNLYSREAYMIRQHVRRAGFIELRNAFLRLGGAQTAKFLQLDKEIEDLTAPSQLMTPINPATGSPMPPIG